jgi:hypothetical protein
VRKRSARTNSLGLRESELLAAITIAVAPSGSDPTPGPTPKPTATPPPAPTPSPTPLPSPGATPSPAPTPTPTGDTTPPLITAVIATDIQPTTANVRWNAGEPATGQVEFGTTPAYGRTTIMETSFNYQNHVQALYNLAPGTLYHFRVWSGDQAGNMGVSSDRTFTTAGSGSTPSPTPTPTFSPTPVPTPNATPTPNPIPTPTPVSTPPTPPTWNGGAYGSVQGDSRNNHQVGQQNNRLAFRFRASTSSAVESIRVQQRGLGGGNSYSGGDGGTIRASIQTDNAGKPSGTILSSLTFRPGNPSGSWEVWTKLTFPSPATLNAGQLYHVVFDNVDAAPNSNWISINILFYWGGQTPRQPTFSDDYAVLYASPTTWAVQAGETPIMDLAYANGSHEGMSYIGAMGEYYGTISGSANQVRQHFTVSGGSRTISTAAVKVKRISGSSPLTIRLETDSGTLIDSVTIPASSIALGNMPASDGGSSTLGGNTWAIANFGSSHVLANGQTYNLRLTTSSDTQYVAVPVQEGTDKGLASYRFTDGDGQKTVNGGSSWANLYLWGYVDLQFYLQ